MDAVPFSAPHKCDLSSFVLRDMVECGRALRQAGEGASSMEATAGRIVQFFYQNLVDPHTAQPNCALVRCFKTHAYGGLPPNLAQAARAILRAEPPDQLPCLTLLATAGELPEWNDRRSSVGHAIIPLESAAMVGRAPMIAALFNQLGLGIETALRPDPQFILDSDQRAFNVFHVEHAEGDPSIPSQENFVRPFGIRSVLGLGGLLPTGDLFTVILFSRVHIPRETASLFRTIALGVKLALLPHTRARIFEEADGHLPPVGLGVATPRSGPIGSTEAEELRSESATLRLLISALEDAAIEQTQRLQFAYNRLKAEGEKVQSQGNRLSAMLEATTDAVFLLDHDWRFTFVNRHAKSLIPHGQDLIGLRIWEIFPAAADSVFGAEFRRAMTEGVEVKFQEYFPAPIDKWFEVHAFPSEGGIAIFFHDVTERLSNEAKLRQTEKLAATGKLAASIAHEINNPLEAVTNLLYLVAGERSLSAEARAYVSLAEEELQRVSEITTHMLRFHRQSTDSAQVDLIEIMESVLILFKGRATQANVEVFRRYPDTAILMGYGGELRQVLANLVGNAIDAARLGGRLDLRLKHAINPSDGRAGIRVTVADTGKGMDAATRKRIFEPFFTTKGITGTGLGLWVSLELIQKHRGTIRVRSSEAPHTHGTIFQIFLPLSHTPTAVS